MPIQFTTPQPLLTIADSTLTRPDWTSGVLRNPAMLWLDKNENTDPELARVAASIIGSMPAHAHNAYPESGPLYRKLAKWLDLAPENLMLAAGSDGCIRSVFETFIGPGDTVLHSAPTFAMYFVYSKIHGATEICIDYQPSDEGPVLDIEDFLAGIVDNKPKLVCLPNPDSPTGTAFDQKTMRFIIEAAGNVGAVMLVDEAYHPFHQETVLSWVNEYPHLVVVRSTGKAWGLAGARIGYAVAAPEMIFLLHKVRSMYEASTLSVAIFSRMLDHKDVMEASVKRLENGKEIFLSAMALLGFKTFQSAGNFCHVNFGDRSKMIHKTLADLVYYRQNFSEACLAGYSRFSATTPELFEPVIEHIRNACEKGV